MKKADYEIERLRLLAHEYQLLQTSIENFDTRALTIKAWSVTFSAAGLTFAYQQKIPIILLVAAASAAAFWIVDTLWKVHQHAFYERVEQIEAIFRTIDSGVQPENAAPFQLTGSWWASAKSFGLGRYIRCSLFGHVMLPHILIVAAGIALYALNPPVESITVTGNTVTGAIPKLSVPSPATPNRLEKSADTKLN